jgi:putative hemolysin
MANAAPTMFRGPKRMAFERSKAVLSKVGMALAFDAAPADQKHIVDVLIAERGERMVKHPLWPILRPLLYRTLHYHEAVRMADDLAPLSGLDGLEYLSSLLKLSMTVTGRERIPTEGGFILVANHPTGIADGIAVYDAIKPVRTDLAIFTNRDAVRVNRRFADVLIPVEWRAREKSSSKTRETLKETNRAVDEGRAIIVFPSGRIAYWANGGLNERPWQTSAVAIARRYGLPVLPVHVSARNSGLFYWFANWNTELRDMTVFHEVLNKKGKPFSVHFGPMIGPEMLDGDLNHVTARLQSHCAEELKHNHHAEFRA